MKGEELSTRDLATTRVIEEAKVEEAGVVVVVTQEEWLHQLSLRPCHVSLASCQVQPHTDPASPVELDLDLSQRVLGNIESVIDGVIKKVKGIEDINRASKVGNKNYGSQEKIEPKEEVVRGKDREDKTDKGRLAQAGLDADTLMEKGNEVVSRRSGRSLERISYMDLDSNIWEIGMGEVVEVDEEIDTDEEVDRDEEVFSEGSSEDSNRKESIVQAVVMIGDDSQGLKRKVTRKTKEPRKGKGGRKVGVCRECSMVVPKGLMSTHRDFYHWVEQPQVCWEGNCHGKRLEGAKSLQMHMQVVHNGEKPFQCSECDKKFGSSMLLEGHMRSKHGEPWLQCGLGNCEASFVWKFQLSKHRRVEHLVKICKK